VIRACVSAAFRVAVTVAHGRSADAVYTLGPLAFWAEAEMTCGFFVICLPCVPKIIKDSGVAGQVKKLTKGSRQNYDSAYVRYEPSSGKDASGQKLDGDAVQMKSLSLEASESTERLHGDGNRAGLGMAITRTTQFTITERKGTFNTKYTYP
jgi:hypothetical protein